MKTLRILVVDDFDPFRQLICGLLEDHSDGWIVDLACDGAEAIQKATQFGPEVILLDIALPKVNGLEAGRQIRSKSPHSKIIFVSQETCPDVIEECLRIGSGYIVKGKVGRLLPSALNTVLKGEQFVCTGVP